MTSLDQMLLWFELYSLQERYISVLDNDQLEAWPDLFTADGHYEIVPKENADADLPMGLIYCNSQGMMRDRIISTREANLYEPQTYRHMVSGLVITPIDPTTARMHASYAVIRTNLEGDSIIYQAGRYEDQAVNTPDGWRYRSKRAIYDTLRVPTLLAIPV
ncbi:MAG: anthranilate 1,2-dioxygenase [Rugosibacter sp.]|nr:MAG: anthranilate 1,2-dioxygenase [Rugosibacter sp.]